MSRTYVNFTILGWTWYNLLKIVSWNVLPHRHRWKYILTGVIIKYEPQSLLLFTSRQYFAVWYLCMYILSYLLIILKDIYSRFLQIELFLLFSGNDLTKTKSIFLHYVCVPLWGFSFVSITWAVCGFTYTTIVQPCTITTGKATQQK